MAINTYDEMLPAMVPLLPDCPVDLIRQALQIKGRDFHVETRAYEVLDTQDLIAGQAQYNLNIPADYYLVSVRRIVWYTDEMIAQGVDGIIRDPETYDVTLPGTVDLFRPYEFPPNADVTNGVQFFLILAPEEDTATVDPEFLNQWQSYIKAGAMEMLYAMPGKPWSSEDGVRRSTRDWIRGIAHARRESYNSFTSRHLSMKAPDFLGRKKHLGHGRYEQQTGGFG